MSEKKNADSGQMVTAEQARSGGLVQKRRYLRVEGPTRPEMLPIFAALLCGAGGLLRASRQDPFGASVMFVAFALHMVFAFRAVSTKRERSKASGPPDDKAAISQFGELLPRLYPGEKLLAHAKATGRDSALLRSIGGAFQVLWGILLAGLPVTLAPSFGRGFFAQMFLGIGTALGAALFGRGIRALFFTAGAEYIARTDLRVIALFAPGSALSIHNNELPHLPCVVARNDGTATVAFALRPQHSPAPLPIRGLYGLEGIEHGEAVRWAKLRDSSVAEGRDAA